VLGVVLAFGLFMLLPSLVFDLINGEFALELFNHSFFEPIKLPWYSYFESGFLIPWSALIEGVIRVIIFVIYMYAVSKMKEIHRVYMYHGAEHKTIFCFEHGNELTVENVKKELRYHPRCGTAFIFVTILLSILVSSIISVVFPQLTFNRAIWIIVKLLIMPLIMGIGFEFIQLAGKYPNNLTKALSAPGLLMQRITTAEPDDAIIEVAIEAMNACMSGKVPEKTENDAENEE
jgi:uncharacterized protein YqhQ